MTKCIRIMGSVDCESESEIVVILPLFYSVGNFNCLLIYCDLTLDSIISAVSGFGNMASAQVGVGKGKKGKRGL